VEDTEVLSKTATSLAVLFYVLVAELTTTLLMPGCRSTATPSEKINIDEAAAAQKVKEDSLAQAMAESEFATAFNAGHELWKNKNFIESIKPLKKASELDADRRYPQIFTELADSYVKLEKPDSALIAYQRAIERYPQNAFFLRNAAWLLTAKQQLSEAIDDYLKAIEIDDQTLSDYENVGRLLVSANRNQEALGIYQKLIELDPNDAEAQKIYALLLSQAGNEDAAFDVK
jgi:tetratricopeptide (TPR) repeat protein